MPVHVSDGPTNVLVVEDETFLRMHAVDIVEDAGFTAVEAVDADEALLILESRSDISLMLSDIQMPGSMDGLKLARENFFGPCAMAVDQDHTGLGSHPGLGFGETHRKSLFWQASC